MLVLRASKFQGATIVRDVNTKFSSTYQFKNRVELFSILLEERRESKTQNVTKNLTKTH